jgi:hypothetical protein
MNEEISPFSALLPILLTEAKRRRLALGLIFAGIALLALIVGLKWPRNYGQQHHHAADGRRRVDHRQRQPGRHRPGRDFQPQGDGSDSAGRRLDGQPPVAVGAGSADPGNKIAYQCGDLARQPHHHQLP